MITKAEYEKALEKIEELLPKIDEEMSLSHPLVVEMDKVCEIVVEYEKIHFPIDD